MTKHFFTILTFCCLFFLPSCYTDDPSGNVDIPLPFGSFSEYFDQNNLKADTLFFDANNNSSVISANGIKLNIPSNAFSVAGNASLVVKEAVNKSDHIFLNIPTVEGSSLISSNGAVYYIPVKNGDELNIENPLTIEIPIPTNASGVEDSNYFYFENDWNADTSVELTEVNSKISFESTHADWQMTGKVLSNANAAQLTIKPVGYGIIPNDMRVFVVFKNENTVIPLTENVSDVSATGVIPTGVEVDVVVMIMDFFNLRIAVQSVSIDEDAQIQVAMEHTTPADMKAKIKELD